MGEEPDDIDVQTRFKAQKDARFSVNGISYLVKRTFMFVLLLDR